MAYFINLLPLHDVPDCASKQGRVGQQQQGTRASKALNGRHRVYTREMGRGCIYNMCTLSPTITPADYLTEPCVWDMHAALTVVFNCTKRPVGQIFRSVHRLPTVYVQSGDTQHHGTTSGGSDRTNGYFVEPPWIVNWTWTTMTLGTNAYLKLITQAFSLNIFLH